MYEHDNTREFACQRIRDTSPATSNEVRFCKLIEAEFEKRWLIASPAML
jgi:hypothetical protein